MLLFILTGSTGNRRVLGISKHLMLLFIDGQKRTFLLTLQDFKTSHVIVYPKEKDGKAWVKGDFKTSHVIVYPFQRGRGCKSWCISKHLMLLFIISPNSYTEQGGRFQNISCYCLSITSRISAEKTGDFKTSHVIVYLHGR